jgi:hypothetical protein
MSIFGEPQSTSYFSAPSETLDPQLFEGKTLKSWVRQGILALLNDHLNKTYKQPETWSTAWLAGSGVSYQWSASRNPGDLDCLVGVDMVQFRKANPEYMGLSDGEISEDINEGFRDDLQPLTADWNGYELTFYVNRGAADIRAIKPYAAYNLTFQEWTVAPDPSQAPPVNPDWEAAVASDSSLAHKVVTRYTQALQDVTQSHNGAVRRNAEARLTAAMQQGNALYNDIHVNRSKAFGPGGEGYADFNNYRWQAGKREGTVQALRQLHTHSKSLQNSTEAATYGIELPDANTLIRRAALYGRAQ